jgi:cobalt-zinc-cadmium efflux system protein
MILGDLIERRHGHAAGPDGPGRALALALGVTLVLMAVEAVGGWLSGSLALLADAGHLLVDVGSLGVAAVGSWLATRPVTVRMSYGYRRAEILAAATNGVALWAVAAAIGLEAVQRLRVPHPVAAPGMLAVAVVGLAGNLTSSALLARAHGQNLNVRAALTHVLADAAAAVGTIAASLVILTTGWTVADTVVSVGVAALAAAGSWPLLREAVGILMEGTPRGVSLMDVEEAMRAVPGVRGVHDLHIWSLTAGVPAVSGHVLVRDALESQRVLGDLGALLCTRFGLTHVTLQVETEELREPWHPNCAPGAGPHPTP